jgi:hypothetical protein
MAKRGPHLSEFKDLSGLRLELAVSRLSDKDKAILRKRTAEAQHRASLKLFYLSLLQLVLNSTPIPKDVQDHYLKEYGY